MEKYNYWKKVANDGECWMDRDGDPFDISQFSNREEAADWLFDELYAEDSITGNGGGFYDSESNCEEYLCHNIDLAFQACDEFCIGFKTLRSEYCKNTLARYLDCVIRCYVLMTAIYDALKIWESYGFKYGENKNELE